MSGKLDNIQEAIQALQQGEMIILVDDEDRENEGDLMMAAEKITADDVNFMTQHGRGLLCLAMQEQDIDRLQLPLMVKKNQTANKTAFTVSIEASEGVTTGISTADRAHTIRVAANPCSTAKDVISPGHIFPLRAVNGGVLIRPGHTEGATDLMKLAGLLPSAAICEILNDDGSMARLDDLLKFAKQHQLKIISIQELIIYRLQHEHLVQEITQAKLPLERYGDFIVKIFDNSLDEFQHVALIHGELDLEKPVLVRIHSECLTGDAFGSARCDCGWQLEASIKAVSERNGIVLYMHQEGRGIGLANKIKAYALQDTGLDTVEANKQLGFEADLRDYKIAANILNYLGVKKIALLTNNPAKVEAVKLAGIEVTERVPLEMPPTRHSKSYLQTKRDKLGHWLSFK